MGSSAPRRASLIGLVLSAALFVGIGGLTIDRILGLRAANTAVEHTLLVRSAAQGLLSLLDDAETGERGFVITGLAEYATPYQESAAALPKRIEEFRRLTADNPVQQQNISAFEGLAVRRMTLLREGIAARQEFGFESAAEIVAGGEGVRLMSAAREVVAKMVAEEDRLWHERDLEQRAQTTRLTVVGLGGLAASFAMLLLAIGYVARMK